MHRMHMLQWHVHATVALAAGKSFGAGQSLPNAWRSSSPSRGHVLHSEQCRLPVLPMHPFVRAGAIRKLSHPHVRVSEPLCLQCSTFLKHRAEAAPAETVTCICWIVWCGACLLVCFLPRRCRVCFPTCVSL